MTVKLEETEIKIGFSFFLTVCLMLIFCSEEIVIISVLSSFFHECGHLFMMYLSGEKPKRIVFEAFGVRIEKSAFSNISYKKEIFISAGGIIADGLLCLIAGGIYYFNESSTAVLVVFINAFIGLFNMIPVKTLDMGRIINFALLKRFDESRCEEISDKISLIFTCVFLLFTVLYSLCVKVNISLIVAAVYLTINIL